MRCFKLPGFSIGILFVIGISCSNAQKKTAATDAETAGENAPASRDEIRTSLKKLSEGAHLFERSSDPTEGPQQSTDLVWIDHQTYFKIAEPPRHLEHGLWVVTTDKNPLTIVANKSRIEIGPHSAVQFRFAPLMQSDLRIFYGSLKLTLEADSAYSEAVLRFEQSDFILKSGIFFATAQNASHLAYVWNIKGLAQAKQPGLPALEPLQIPASSLAEFSPKKLIIRKPHASEKMRALKTHPKARERLFQRN